MSAAATAGLACPSPPTGPGALSYPPYVFEGDDGTCNGAASAVGDVHGVLSR